MNELILPYVPDVYAYRRRPTRVVMVGDVAVGGDNPIRVQSMTTTTTQDIDATADQAERLIRAGCEIVRITTPTPRDARCLGDIRGKLAARGIRVPIVADIHFSPQAALVAADYADKVRVNPGNYVDSRKFAVREYSDAEYEEELRRVEERFTPLVLKCKERAIAMRIGTNHGSLSDRIMNRFGDTPEGMVESALEFVRICEKNDYHDIILSMKASNPKVMIEAYRLLAARMAQLGMEYPFHLGVTEAGNGEDGRIKSAAGIGSLLEDGIGDTIRVSLTEEPEEEIPVAYAIARRYPPPHEVACPGPAPTWDPYHFERRPSAKQRIAGVPIGGDETVAVIATIEGPLGTAPDAMARVLRWASPAGKRQPKPDLVVVRLESETDIAAFRTIAQRLAKWPQAHLGLVVEAATTDLLDDALALASAVLWDVGRGRTAEVIGQVERNSASLVLAGTITNPEDRGRVVSTLLDVAGSARSRGIDTALMLRAPERERIHAYRALAARAIDNRALPIILAAGPDEGPLLPASITLGSLLCDGIGDAVLIAGDTDTPSLAFNILQATGTRLSKTDYVACPSCGRTLFDLQETTERIKQRTAHLVGVKLAIMGCIVNGPGEMADADFGYVGGAPGRVNLYVGKECVEKGVPAEDADDRLVELIKSRGKWQDEE